MPVIFPTGWVIVREQRTLLNLKEADPESIARLTKAISGTRGLALPVSFEPGRWFLSNLDPGLNRLSRDYLLTLLYSRLADYSAAAENMALFLRTEAAKSGPMLYYKTLHSYLEAKKAGLTDARIKEMLTETFGEVMANRVLEHFAVPERVLEHPILPSCFDCSKCRVEGSCRYLALLRRVKALQRLQQKNMPLQTEVAKVFQQNGSDT